MSGSKTTQTNTALQPYLGAYSSLLGQAQSTASQPLQQYQGNIVAPFNAQQQQGFDITGNAAGSSGYALADPYFNSAQQDFSAATTPLWSNTQQFSPQAVGQYESPYTQDVVNATQNQFNLQNAQQQTGLEGNLAAAGAFGGDRQAVLQAQLAGQQQTSQAPVIAGLENQGYNTALGEFNTQQQAQLGANEANAWLNSQAAFGEGNLGSTVQNAAFSGANALQSSGGEQQQLAQEQLNVPYEQFLQQQAYPFQTEQWLANMETGLGGAAGSTSTTKQSQSLLSQILGGLSSGIGLIGQTGGFGSNGWLTGSSGTSQIAPSGVPDTNIGTDLASTLPYGFKRGGAAGRGIIIPFPAHRTRGGRGIAHRDAGGPMIPGETIPMPTGVPNLDVSVIPDSAIAQHGSPAKANAQPQQQGGGGGGGLASLASAALPFIMAARRGGGIGHYADGGDTDDHIPTPANTQDDTGDIKLTGTDGQMPYPHIAYTPHQTPDTWSQDINNAPWTALTEAGAEMLASGNIGRGIQAGEQTYEGIRNRANQQREKALAAEDEGNYKQADVEMGADKLWSEAQDAAARLKQADAFHAEEGAHWSAEEADRQRGLDLTAAKDQADNPFMNLGGTGAGTNGAPSDPYAPIASKITGAENTTGNPAAKNPRSTATGNGQFIDSTWLQVARTAMPEVTKGLTDQQVQQLRLNPAFSQEATEAYAKQNATVLSAAGQPVNGTTLAMSHRLGPQGALSVLKADPTTPLKRLLSPAAIAANPELANQTAGHYAQTLRSQFGTDPVADAPQAATAGPSKTSDVHGQDYLKTLPGPLSTQVQALAEGREAFPSGYAISKPYWQNMLQAVSQYDPTFDAVNYNARQKTRNDFTSGKSAMNIKALNTAIGHLGRWASEIPNVAGHGGFPFATGINAIQNWYAENEGEPGITRFKQDANALSTELTQVFRGTGGNEADIDRYLQGLSPNASTEQKAAAAANIVGLLHSRLNAIGDQYTQGMGTTAQPLRLLTPEAQAVVDGVSGKKPQAKPATAVASPQPHIPAPPRGVPSGSAYSPSRNMWRDPAGKLYNAQGQPVQ